QGTESATRLDESGRRVTGGIDSLAWFEQTQPVDTGLQVFGAELFRNTDIRFEPNLNIPTPRGYIVGTGDELLLDLTGDNEASYRLTVSPEGTINVDYVGIVSVAGLAIEDVASKL